MVRTDPGSTFTPGHTIGHFKSLAIMNKAAVSTVVTFMGSGFEAMGVHRSARRMGREGSVIGRDRREAQRAMRMSGNLQLTGFEGKGKGEPENFPENWDRQSSQELMQVTLAKMPNSWDIDPKEGTCCSLTGSPVE